MRKKSHISLARYIVANTEDEGLKNTGCRFILEASCRIVSHLLSINGMRLPVHFQTQEGYRCIDPWKREPFSQTETDVLHESGGDHALRSRLFYLSAQ